MERFLKRKVCLDEPKFFEEMMKNKFKMHFCRSIVLFCLSVSISICFCLSIYVSAYLSICPSFHASVNLPALCLCPFVYLFFLCLSTMSVCLSVCPSICLLAFLSSSLYVCQPLHLYYHHSVSPYVRLTIYLSSFPFIFISFGFFVSV